MLRFWPTFREPDHNVPQKKQGRSSPRFGLRADPICQGAEYSERLPGLDDWSGRLATSGSLDGLSILREVLSGASLVRLPEKPEGPFKTLCSSAWLELAL